MESLHMNQQVFANYIGQAAGTISGILTGRTHPSMSVVESIKTKIPDISTDWLIFGKGEMYETHNGTSGKNAMGSDGQPSPQSAIAQSAAQSPRGAQAASREPMLDFTTPTQSTPAQQRQTFADQAPSVVAAMAAGASNFIEKPLRKVTEIRVYYDDQTWESFVPSKK